MNLNNDILQYTLRFSVSTVVAIVTPPPSRDRLEGSGLRVDIISVGGLPQPREVQHDMHDLGL